MKHYPIPYHTGYEIDEYGNVYSVLYNWRNWGIRKMVQYLDIYGYPHVRLTINGTRKRIAVHRLMALVFLPIPPTKEYEIRHLDGNKQNNHESNLVWGTQKDNAEDREKHGKTSRGIDHSIAIRKGLEMRGYNVKW